MSQFQQGETLKRMCQRDIREVPSIFVGKGGEKGMLKEKK